MRFAAWPILALLLAPSSVFAQQDTSFKNVEYLSGSSAMQEKQKGILVVSAAEVRLVDKKGTSFLTIPFQTITTVKDSVVTKKENAVKKKVMGRFGFGGGGPQEQLIISTQKDSASIPEVVIFKINDAGLGRQIAAKIRARMSGKGDAAAQGAAGGTPAADAAPLPRMLVANPFVADGADSAAAVEVGTSMRDEVSKILGEKLQIITREQMNKVLEPYGYPPDAILSQSVIVTLATSIEAAVLLSGSMAKGQDGRYTVSAKLGGVNDTTGTPTIVVQEPNEKLEAFGLRIVEALKGPPPAAPAPGK